MARMKGFRLISYEDGHRNTLIALASRRLRLWSQVCVDVGPVDRIRTSICDSSFSTSWCLRALQFRDDEHSFFQCEFFNYGQLLTP